MVFFKVLQVQDLRSHLVEENNKLREGLATAISKAEKYKEDAEASKESFKTLEEELKKAKEGKVRFAFELRWGFVL